MIPDAATGAEDTEGEGKWSGVGVEPLVVVSKHRAGRGGAFEWR